MTYPHTVWEAGLATAWRGVRVGAAATRTSTVGESRIEFVGDPPLQVTVRDALRYVDAALTVEARPSRLELDGSEQRETLADLTPRELEVAEQVASGASNKEIASALGISPGACSRRWAYNWLKVTPGSTTA